MTAACIEIRDLKKSFGGTRVLDGVTLDVREGESFALIGRSGVGKSVLLKCVLGLIHPDAGTVLVRGEKPVQRAGRPGGIKIGMLFQGGALFDSMPVWQNVAFRQLKGNRKSRKAEARDSADRLLGRVGLSPEVGDRFPSELSGGMQKRASLARAIAEDPEIILFDEPTTGLDPIMSSVINSLIRSIVKESGATAVTITHDMPCVRTVADRVALLHDGVIQWSGSADALDSDGNPHLRQFVHGREDGPMAPAGD